MTTVELLSHLRSLDVRLSVVDGRLRLNAPDGVLTPQLRAEIAERKVDIIAFLRGAREAIQSAAAPITPVLREGDLPLSFAQQRMWFLDQLEPGNPFYNIPNAVGLSGQLDVAALRRSLNEIVRRHQALRTTFASVEGRAIQVIAPTLSLSLPVADLREIAGAEQESRMQRLMAEEALRPFDLARGPLVRAALLRLGEEEHMLLLTMHHIISDAWSGFVLIRELTTLYRAFIAGKPSPLPELPIQYVDFAVWQRQWLQGQVLEGLFDYWRRQLDVTAPVAALPSDRPRKPAQTWRGKSLSFVWPRSLAEALKALSQEEGVTLFATLLAAFDVLLYRYNGQDDVNVGTFIANRNTSQVEELIGVFINVLVLRASLSGDPSFRELLQRVYAMTLEAYAHQDIPYDKLLEELQPERDRIGTPLFRTMLVLQPLIPTIELPGLAIKWIRPDREEAHPNSDLDLFLEETEEGLFGIAEYNADLFDAVTIRRTVGHLRRVMEAVSGDPGQRISHIPVLTEGERRQLLVEWNSAAADYPRDRCIHDLIEAQVEQTPEAVAVVVGGERVTYAALNRRANQLARYLQRLGVGPEERVGICVERSVEMVVGLLGILKAGGAYAPLDPMYPPERLAFMQENAHLSILLTQGRLADRLAHQKGHVVCLDSDWATIAQGSLENLTSGVMPDNLMYVIYTSGSTGRPKGAGVYQRSFVNLLNWFVMDFGLDADERVLLISSLSFDLTQKNLYAPLMIGGELHLSPSEEYDAEKIVRAVCDECITWLNCTPSAFYPLVEQGDESVRAKKTLRHVFLGGEPISMSRLSAWINTAPCGMEIVNTYGPTECTDICASYRVNQFEELDRVVPIGKPIPNTRVLILDQNLEPLPVGVVGELYVGGEGVGRGYINQLDLTLARFIPDPFSAKPGMRLYKSGDLASFRPDGNIEFLGRIDHQVKVRGFRIELGEIETILGQHPSVYEAVVMAREVERVPDDKQLVAYVVAREGQELAVGELRRYLQDRLPSYMIPAAFVVLAALPLTPNGKVDRRALPAPDLSRSELDQAFVPPRTPVEVELAGIWGEILGLEQVGAHDNFFELGGHSLLATQVVSRVRSAFEIELSLRELFDLQTVAEMAARIEAIRQSKQSVSAPPIAPVAREGQLPLSFAQQRLWVLEQLEPGNAAYHIHAASRLTGQLDVAALKQGLNQVVGRHEALRTTLVMVEGKAVQVIAPTLIVPLPLVDLGELPTAVREARVQILARQEAQQPFDLARGPLMRCTLLRLGDQEHVLLLTMHHIVSDAWSMGVFFQELVQAGLAYAAGQPSALPELAIQYVDFAVWQRQWLRGEVLAEQLAYWKRQLEGAPAMLEMPTDRPRPAAQTYFGALESFRLPEAVVQALDSFSRQEGVTPFMALLAAFQTLLYRYTGQDDIVVGSPIANRNRREIEGLIGFFVNTLALRTSLAGNPTFRELLGRVRDVTLGAYAHQDLPFEMLVDELQLERDLSRNPLFQVMFVLQNAPGEVIEELPGLTIERLEIDRGMAQFDLTLSMEETSHWLNGTVEYNTDLFDAATISRLAGHFRRLLDGVLSNPGRRLADLAFLTEPERRQVLIEWNDTPVEYPGGQCVHELFEAQIEQAPDAIAVVFEEQQVSYRELNRRTNQLAHYLRALGVGPEGRVGICLERSVEMVIAIYGILKAGGAYVPLDPTYPRERLAYMMADAQAPVLLTQQHLVIGQERGARVVCLDSDWADIAPASEANPLNQAASENLAYIIYTSGSTGNPKGAMNTHGGIRNRIQWMQDAYGLKADDRVLQKTPFSFDVSVWEFVWPLMSGACLVVARPEGHKDTTYLIQTIQDEQVTTLHFVPSMLQAFLEDRAVAECTSLRRVMCSGEALPRDLQGRFFERFGAELHNLYGPTEAAVDVTCWACERGSWRRIVPIGRPIANIQIYLLDASLNPVPIGVPGELHIGGVGLARGYFNRSDLTAAKFVPAPSFSQAGEKGARLYKTGDLARYLPDGSLEFLGRVDYQVKVRGFRIELGEIEAALSQCPAVREAVVIARDVEPGQGESSSGVGKRLVAYLVADNGRTPTVSELHSFLKEKLPDYMLPSAFVTLEAIPLTPSGKVDRRALPAPERARPELERAFVAPRTQAEKLLTDIWTQVLNVERVGIHDNFFELGGDSILGIQVVARANAAGLKLNPRQLFEHRTIAELAAVAGVLSTSQVLSEQEPATGPVPLTPIQHWFFEQDLADPHHFNQAILLEVDQSLNPALMEPSLRQLLAHHDGLGLRFKREGTGWQQVCRPPDSTPPLVCVDLSALPEAKQSPALEAAAAGLQASLNLSEGPIMRVALFDLGAQKPKRLLMVIHHLAVDGVSWRILLEDLQIAYSQSSQGKAIRLPLKTTSFKRWAERLMEYAQSDRPRRELDYWLAESWKEAHSLPVDYPGGENTVASARSVSVSLSVGETQALLRDVPKAYRIQIDDALLTALALAFVRWTGDRALLVDLEGHGREEISPDIDLSRTVGWFTSIFPVLLDLDGVEDIGDALKSVKERLRQVPNGGINYGVLRYLSRDAEIAERLHSLPQAQVIFNYLGQFDQVLAGSTLFRPARESSGPSQSLRAKRQYLLEVNGYIGEGQLQLTWTYSQNLYHRSTIEGLAQEFVEALRALVLHCQSPEARGFTPSDFPEAMLSQTDLDELVAEFGEFADERY